MSDTPTAEKTVEELLPLHGPYDRDLTVRAGHLIDNEIRYLNYATRNAEALPDPAALYDLIGVLKTSADKLPQTLRQSGQRLRRLSDDPALVNKSLNYWSSPAAHEDAVVKAEQANVALQHAAALAKDLAVQLSYVQSLLSQLGMQTTSDDTVGQ